MNTAEAHINELNICRKLLDKAIGEALRYGDPFNLAPGLRTAGAALLDRKKRLKTNLKAERKRGARLLSSPQGAAATSQPASPPQARLRKQARLKAWAKWAKDAEVLPVRGLDSDVHN